MSLKLLLESKHCTMYREREQRKKGRTKNRYVITLMRGVARSPQNIKLISELLQLLISQGGELRGTYSVVFKNKEQAEKAWVYLNLRYE